MLNLRSSTIRDLAALTSSAGVKEVKEYVTDSRTVFLAQRSTTVALLSTGIGVTSVYYGIKNGRKNGWWHLATALGAFNLYGNIPDLGRRFVSKV